MARAGLARVPTVSAPTTAGGRLTLVVCAHAPLGGPIASALAADPSRQVVLVGDGPAGAGVEVLRAAPGADRSAVVAELLDRRGALHTLVEVPSRLQPGQTEPGEVGAPGVGELEAIVERLDLVVTAMAAAGRGRVVLVAEASGIPGREWDHRRAAVMWGLVGVARARTRDEAERGVTFNVVRAGLVDTPALAAAVAADASVSAAVSAVVAATPLRRPVTVDEVSAAVAYLASDEAGFTSGSVVPVDGGLTMGLGS